MERNDPDRWSLFENRAARERTSRVPDEHREETHERTLHRWSRAQRSSEPEIGAERETC